MRGPIPKKTAPVHHVTAEEAILDDGVIAGKLRINSISARVLFDPGASHSFMHERYVQENEFSTMDFAWGFQIQAPRIIQESNKIVSKAKVELAGLEFLAHFIVMKLGDEIDAIFRMNWMVKHKCAIRCMPRSVEMHHPFGRTTILYAAQSQLVALQSLRAQPNVSKGVELILVVCEFPDVFLEELTGMPPGRYVEFLIQLEPRTAPISK